MPAIITDRFRIKNAGDFIESVDEDNLFLFIGKITPWADDNAPPLPEDSTIQTSYEHWEDMLAAKKVTTSDIVHVVRRYNWEAGRDDYVAYNPNDSELFRKQFYVLADNNGQLNVYKLLVKGAGTTADKPTSTDKNGTVAGTDGYVWKYMYTVGATDAIKFLTPQHIPVRNESNNALAAADNVGLEPAPIGGHGADNIQELGAFFTGINVRLEFGEIVNGEETFTTENDFRKIGLVFNPLLAGTQTLATAGAFRQTTRLQITISPNSPSTVFEVDEEITVTGSPGETARVVFHDTENNLLFVNIEDADYNPSTLTIDANSSIVGTNSGTTATVDSNTPPGLQPYSGEVLYIENRKPIPRANDQIESLTIILEF